jgi:hypothetical protein
MQVELHESIFVATTCKRSTFEDALLQIQKVAPVISFVAPIMDALGSLVVEPEDLLFERCFALHDTALYPCKASILYPQQA